MIMDIGTHAIHFSFYVRQVLMYLGTNVNVSFIVQSQRLLECTARIAIAYNQVGTEDNSTVCLPRVIKKKSHGYFEIMITRQGQFLISICEQDST